MSTHRERRVVDIEDPPPRSKCITCLCFSWKIFTCIFSHITLIALVVGYCVAGAVIFNKCEEENEKAVKAAVKYIRSNATHEIWLQTQAMEFLKEDVWINRTKEVLFNFERNISRQMKELGWDGNEELHVTRWDFPGSLFYSIIVITTIGYGHIAPKTTYGKIATIFYSIVGIPLMLLCLSNIGDIMASSFRFLYWRVCCYVCTREPKKNRKRQHGQMMRRELIRQQHLALQDRSRVPYQTSMRRSMKTSQRSADSGFDQRYDAGMSHAYSDMDCRYQHTNGRMFDRENYHEEREKRRGMSQRSERDLRDRVPPSPKFSEARESRNRGSYKGEFHTLERDRVPRREEPDEYEIEEDIEETSPRQSMKEKTRIDRDRDFGRMTPQPSRQMRYSEDRQMGNAPRYAKSGPASRVQSLDRRMMRRENVIIDFEREPPCKVPVYFNKYAMDDEGRPREQREPRDREPRRAPPSYRSQSMPRQSRYGDRLLPPGGSGDNGSIYNDNGMEMQPKGRKRERPAPAPSPRIMSPMGFAVHRQARHIASIMDENSLYGDDVDDDMNNPSIRPVPIWLCVFLVIGYILGGAWLFKKWEKWDYLDSAYFCFITLTTIGFGDFVPAQVGDNTEVTKSIALCSIYLLFGIALLAMSFNLVQEEVIAKVKQVAKSLGIIKEEEEEIAN